MNLPLLIIKNLREARQDVLCLNRFSALSRHIYELEKNFFDYKCDKKRELDADKVTFNSAFLAATKASR